MNTPLHTRLSPRTRGFTLIELLVVLAITAVLVGVAVPSFAGLIRSTKLTSATNDLFSSLLLARSEAVKRKSRVTLCKSANGTICATTGGWDQGWIVFHDANNNGVHDPGEEIVWRAQPMSTDVRESGNSTVAKYISYSPTGEAKLVGGGFQAGTITLCNVSSKGEEARDIVISASGRPRVQKAHVNNCI